MVPQVELIGGGGKVAFIAPYEQNAWNLYGELGVISRWLTATVESTLVRDNLQANAHTTGIGDGRFGSWSGSDPLDDYRSEPASGPVLIVTHSRTRARSAKARSRPCPRSQGKGRRYKEVTRDGPGSTRCVLVILRQGP